MDPERIFNIQDDDQFVSLALSIFKFQYTNNLDYRAFCDHLGTDLAKVRTLEDIPFFPIEFFRTKSVSTSIKKPEATFISSGTTGSIPSKHHIIDLSLYQRSYKVGFERFYGRPQEYCILALLPSYLERQGSSLVYMVNDLIRLSKHPDSGFYLKDQHTLAEKIQALDNQGTKVILIGVSFALLDMAESYKLNLKNTIVMETGGMKGRRKELIRKELHEKLKSGFGVSTIHSEYGMTELLSQAYSKGDGIFNTPPWMKVLIRDTEDALSWQSNGRSGGINVIDLANLYSCSFIATQDLGKLHKSGGFEVIGRFDHADIRGCNLMAL